MTDRSLDLAGLSPESKRALLSQLLMADAENSASVHPLSYGQQSLWFVHQLAPASAAYTIMYAGRISGELDVPSLERAAQALVDRHPMLRTTYSQRDGQPVQLVHPHWPVRIARYRLGADPSELQEWIRRETDRPFDLYTGPVLRLTLLQRAPDDHVLLLAVHHIAVDFWSIDVILDELRLLYAAEHNADQPLDIQPPAERYVDHADRQTRTLEGVEGQRLWDYWREQLGGELPILALPTDQPRPAVQTYRGAVYRFTVDSSITTALKQVGRTVGATPYMTLLAAYATLLHRYTGQGDLIVGSPFACRDRAGLTGLVGYLANPVALRIDLHDDPTFTSLLGAVKDTVLGALAHQDYPFGVLVERLSPVRDAGRTPLFQVSFAWEQMRRFSDGAGAKNAGLHLETLHIGQGGAPFDVLMQVGEQDGGLAGALQYNTDLFDAATIERMSGHFATLLDGIAGDPDRRLSQLPLLTEDEGRQLAAWNHTQVDYDGPACLHDMVAATAARIPDAVAVTCGDRDVTYSVLDRRANGLAHRLQRLGVGPDVVVPVLLDRCEELVVALLGVLKAGGAFLPLDPAQPTQRIAAMLADLPDAPVCVTHRQHLGDVPTDFTGARLCLDQAEDQVTAVAPVAGTTSGDLAYVIYTSGSTGTPKGALNTHAGICNRLSWMQHAYPLAGDDRVLHKTPISFDPFIWEIFWPLIAGARVVIAQPEGHKDASYLIRTIVEQGITAMHFVPSMLRRVLAEPGVAGCVGLRRVFCSGEVLPADVRDDFLTTLDAELYNLYGPTEAAIDVTGFHCRRGVSDPSVPIGRPIANVEIRLLDGHRRPVPVGVPGELFIGGVAVGRGYLNRPEETAAGFIDDPSGLCYRTGDLARYLPDGNIEFLGRLDDQVKVRGFRIEPGEVEAALAKHPTVAECAVVAGNDGHGNPLLIAHVVAGVGPAPSTAELRRFLLELLPAAMVPAVFALTGTLPLTSNGKVDRQALSAADGAPRPRQSTYVAPRTRTEQVLAQIWCEVLDVEQVSVTDDFFGLGGASTQSLEVAVRANAAGLALRPESMFVYGTIAELAAEYGPIADGPPAPEIPDLAASPPERVITAPAEPVPWRADETRNTVIESLGGYLPARATSTGTVLAGCTNEIDIPLERLTGIKSRRMAGDNEFSIDLASRAATDCLARSSYAPEEIDLIISCNISRCDGPGHRFTFEPSTAAQLRESCGLVNALAFDISNACAGMFTGIAVADAFLKTGLIRSAMVVSGEYISHLTETAQREMAGPMDPQLACLTLGDAGAAVIVERGPDNRVGFHDIDMATLSRYAKLCIAKMSDGPHGGAIMVADSVTQTAVAVKHSLPYVAAVMQRHGWRPETCDHVLMHQTSAASLNDAVTAINRMFGRNAVSPDKVINNLAERGNTATTTHFVALADQIRNGRIGSGDNVVFSITGSGQTVGAALYTFDDLPDRIRRGVGDRRQRRGARTGSAPNEAPAPPRVRIDAVGIAPAAQSTPPRSLDLAVSAAAACLQASGLDRSELGLLIHAGVYRDEFLSEPAIAALVAGELGINGDVDSADGPKTFTFDVLNGGVGFLNACHAAVGMIGAGRTANAMVLASEIENNTPESGYPLNGISQTGSAVLLGSSDNATGFGRFVFQSHPEYGGALQTYTQWDGQTWLQTDRDPSLAGIYLDCIPSAIKELLTLDGLDPSDIAIVLPPCLSADALSELAFRIGIPRARFVDLAADADLFTSALPYALEHARRHGLARPGDLALIVAVGSGVQVGATTYRF